MEASTSVINRYVTAEFVKSLRKTTSLYTLKVSYCLSSILLISTILLSREKKTVTKNVSLISYSEYFISSFLLFTLCSIFIPYYVSKISNNIPYFVLFAFILQIVNLILFHELSYHEKTDNLIFSIIGIQSICTLFLTYRL